MEFPEVWGLGNKVQLLVAKNQVGTEALNRNFRL